MSNFDFTNQDGSGDLDDMNNWTQDGSWPAYRLPAGGDTATNSTAQTINRGTFNGDLFSVSSGGSLFGGTFNGSVENIAGVLGGATFNGRVTNSASMMGAICNGPVINSVNNVTSCTFNGVLYDRGSGVLYYGCQFGTYGYIVIEAVNVANLPTFSGSTFSNDQTQLLADPAKVLNTATNLGVAGTATPAPAIGTLPAASDVRQGAAVGFTSGTCYVPAASDVRHGVNVDAGTGTCYVPTASQVVSGVNVDATSGNVRLPAPGQVQSGDAYGAASADTGTYNPMAAAVFPRETQVLTTIPYGPTGAEYTGTLTGGSGGLTADEHDALLAIQAKTDNLPADPAAALSIADYAAIADAVLSRSVVGVEASADPHSLCFVVLAMSESNTTANANMLTVFRSDGTTEFVRKALTSSPAVDAITGVS